VKNRGAAAPDGTPGAVVSGNGFYVAGAYTLFGRVQGAARLGVFDPDAAVAAAEDARQLTELGLAVSYFLSRKENKEKTEFYTDHPEYHEAKLQLGFSRFMPTSTALTPASELILAV
jgi:hypothetical protein